MTTPAAASALIDLLLTVGYLDGLYHPQEQAFIQDYIGRLAQALAHDRAPLESAYARLERDVAALSAEVMSTADAHYVDARLKTRAVALFRAFEPTEQASALHVLHALVHVDGVVSAPERALYEELLGYFHAAPPPPVAAAAPPPPLSITEPRANPLAALTHPLLDPIEQAYAAQPEQRFHQAVADHNLVLAAIDTWTRARAEGAGRLTGVTDIGQLPPGTRALVGSTHVHRPDRPVELVVLGDLHGCYSCLKAALLQSDFINRARAHQQDSSRPDVKLVLLGDYIDRGRFGFEGVLRAALQLVVTFPQHVIMLRGNHELFVKVEDKVVSAVKPAEALDGIAGQTPPATLEAYLALFEHMPTSLLFDRTMFVHGGIPRDDTFASQYKDLSSLDDFELKFQMMWSDPEPTDTVPVELQRQTPRFAFGREQFRAFMQKLGMHTMIRGHEQIDSGFSTVFDVGGVRLLSLFSAGGHDNPDLPAGSAYRSVTPMALTVRHDPAAGTTEVTPWPIQYKPFADPPNNGLYRT